METSTEVAILNDDEGQLLSLKETFHKVQSKFSEWMKCIDVHIEYTGNAHLEEIAKKQKAVEDLQERITSLKNQQNLKKTACATLEEEAKKVESILSAVQKETDSILLRKENLEKEAQTLLEVNATNKELLDTQNAAAEQTTKELEKSLDFFRDRLGLQLKKVSGGRMQLIFTCIDYQDPTHPFFCFIKITPDRKYEVSECTPDIVGFRELVNRLNSDNDFKTFVQGLRKAFMATVS